MSLLKNDGTTKCTDYTLVFLIENDIMLQMGTQKYIICEKMTEKLFLISYKSKQVRERGRFSVVCINEAFSQVPLRWICLEL